MKLGGDINARLRKSILISIKVWMRCWKIDPKICQSYTLEGWSNIGALNQYKWDNNLEINVQCLTIFNFYLYKDKFWLPILLNYKKSAKGMPKIELNKSGGIEWDPSTLQEYDND